MRSYLATAVVIPLAVMATPAAATIIITSASDFNAENILFNEGVRSGTTIDGFTNITDTRVLFTTMAGTTALLADGGQARVTGGLDASTRNPNDTVDLDNLSFSLFNGGTFNNVEFRIFGGDGTASFSLTDNAGQVFDFNGLALTGDSRFAFQGIDGQSIRSASLSVSGGFQDLRQVRLSPLSVAAVPEPGTWAMMILGFGMVGGSLRAAKRRQLAKLSYT